ncbi:MAG TPA: hypothetical protein VGO68_16890 [Pyrinomonadaceae bacterium]|jgi:hypothetical protein|nr:hypothetical protein [Pyrinomonadaceae bacterium]
MKLRLLLVILAVVVCSVTRPVSAQAPAYADPLLDRLIGTWVLRGQIAHKETTHDVVAEWVLGHEYVRIHEVAREKDGKGNAAYEAIVFIGSGKPSHDYACLWLDSTGGGGLVPEGIGHAMRAGEEIPIVFLDGHGEISFKNTFAYDKSTDSWAWIMDNVVGGKAIPFARVKLTRS